MRFVCKKIFNLFKTSDGLLESGTLNQESGSKNQSESVATKVRVNEPNLPRSVSYPYYKVQLNLLSIRISMALLAEGHSDSLAPKSVDGTFKGIILIKHFWPLRKTLIACLHNASCLLQVYTVYQMEEQKHHLAASIPLYQR